MNSVGRTQSNSCRRRSTAAAGLQPAVYRSRCFVNSTRVDDHTTTQPASSLPSVTPNVSSSSTPADQPGIVPPPIAGQETRLIDTIEKLIESLEELSTGKSPSGQIPQPSAPQSWFERFSANVDKKIEEFGLANTAIGNLVSGASRSFSGLGTRATQFASSVFGAGAGQAAVAGGETAGAGAAVGAEAGAGAAAGAGATAAATAAGPLIAVALAAGLAALSVKKFMEAVDSVAKDLADLSPDIAIGQAQSDMRMELMRLDRAQRIGPEVAGLNNAQNRLQESMYELQTKFYEVVSKFAPFIETGVNILDIGINTFSARIADINATLALFTLDKEDDKRAAESVAKAAEALNNAYARLAGVPTQEEQNINNMIESMLGFGPQPQGNQPPPIPRQGRK